MLYWTYIAITVYLSAMIVIELFSEKDWKRQVAMGMLLLVFVLRILQIK